MENYRFLFIFNLFLLLFVCFVWFGFGVTVQRIWICAHGNIAGSTRSHSIVERRASRRSHVASFIQKTINSVWCSRVEKMKFCEEFFVFFFFEKNMRSLFKIYREYYLFLCFMLACGVLRFDSNLGLVFVFNFEKKKNSSNFQNQRFHFIFQIKVVLPMFVNRFYLVVVNQYICKKLF